MAMPVRREPFGAKIVRLVKENPLIAIGRYTCLKVLTGCLQEQDREVTDAPLLPFFRSHKHRSMHGRRTVYVQAAHALRMPGVCGAVRRLSIGRVPRLASEDAVTLLACCPRRAVETVLRDAAEMQMLKRRL